MTVAHFDLHRTVARAIDDQAASRHVWVHVNVRHGKADPQLLGQIGRIVDEWLGPMDAHHVPPPDNTTMTMGGENGTAYITLKAVQREQTLRNDLGLPLVLNPYPYVAGYTP